MQNYSTIMDENEWFLKSERIFWFWWFHVSVVNNFQIALSTISWCGVWTNGPRSFECLLGTRQILNEHLWFLTTKQLGRDQRAAWGQDIIPIPAPHTMFWPHYRRYRGNTTDIISITAVTKVLPRLSMLISKLLSPISPLLRKKWEPIPHYRGFYRQ